MAIDPRARRAPRGGLAVIEVALSPPTHKTCCCCCAAKPVARFLHSKHTADGRTDRCLDCIRAAAAAQDRRLRQGV